MKMSCKGGCDLLYDESTDLFVSFIVTFLNLICEGEINFHCGSMPEIAKISL